MDKIYITANELLLDSFTLARLVHDSGFSADFVVGVWRGGTPIAIALQEYFSVQGVKCDHISVRTSSYTGIAQQNQHVNVAGLEYLINNLGPHSKLLLVDDVFDSGRSLSAIIDALAHSPAAVSRENIRCACVWYKPANSKSDISPDYYLHQSDKWLVFPHELAGLSDEEITQFKPDIAAIIANR